MFNTNDNCRSNTIVFGVVESVEVVVVRLDTFGKVMVAVIGKLMPVTKKRLG